MLGILLAATVVAPAPPPARIAPPPHCAELHKLKTADAHRTGPQKLGELPDGEFYHAVLKEAGGCPIDEVFWKGQWIDRWAGRPALSPAAPLKDDR